MAAKQDQHKVGTPKKPRGQQMGDAANPDRNRKEMKETPALGGRRKNANAMLADKSAQHHGGDAVTRSAVTPSVPGAAPRGKKLGETGGEKVFKQRQKRGRKT